MAFFNIRMLMQISPCLIVNALAVQISIPTEQRVDAVNRRLCDQLTFPEH